MNGEKSGNIFTQHRGLGKQLMNQAEIIAKENQQFFEDLL